MPRFLAGLLLLLIGAMPCAVVALGLGEIDLKSALNQPFVAEIPVTSESANDLSGLQVELASAGTFEEFGLDRAAFLTDFEFTMIDRGPDAVVRITSRSPVVEPFVTMLLEITWAQGRLLREYTVLLDPPVFASEVAQPAVAAPVAGPAPTQTDVMRAPSSTPVPAATRPSDAPQQAVAAPMRPMAGGNYGPVQRNDTLWGIAGRYIDGTTANRNQMMLAIYRANPEAFVGNINRLKAGMILRVPDAEEVERLGRREANAEVQRQNTDWKSGRDESPRLRLVPPPELGEGAESAPQTAAGAGSADLPATGTADMQGRIDELEAELSDSRRLIELRDSELQALQEQLASREEIIPEPETATVVDEAPVEAEPDAEPVAVDDGTAEEPVEAVAEEIAEPEALAPGPGVVVTTSPSEEPSLIAQLFSSVWLYVSLAIVLLLGWLFIRRRTAVEGPADSWDRLDTGPGGDFDAELAGATTSLGAPSPEDRSFVVEEAPREEDTAAIDDSAFASGPLDESAFAADEEEPELPFERTISAESAVNLDQADPVAEADFHMAYGLYDQAADLLSDALESDPDRQDLRLKLLEVYFIWENQGGFLKEAQILHDSIDGAADPDWNKVLIMGKQICPAEELFAAAPSAPAETDDIDLDFGEDAELGEDADIDITFGAAEENVDLLFEDGDEAMIDFDLTGEQVPGDGDSPTEETPTIEAESAGVSTMETPTVESSMLEPSWDVSGGETTMETPTVESPAAETTMETPTVESSMLEPPLDVSGGETTMETPTVESPAAATTMETPTVESSMLEPGLDVPGGETTMETPTVETTAGDWGMDEVESQSEEPVEQTAEIDLDDLGLDLADIDDEGEEDADVEMAPGEAGLAASDFGFEASELDETGLKPKISGEEAAAGLDADDQAIAGLMDIEPTAQMQNVDLDSWSGDTVEQPAVGDTAEQPAIGRDAGLRDDVAASVTDLDIGEDIALDDEPTGALDTSAGAVVEGATMTEVGTKLDLARAYIDMGDPDGARSILNEVLEEAVDSQRQEAQKLLDDLGD
ncbi:MAG: LysM peptidoglycan-binding domain-containing protein [Gammaproteobacteria bacterium]|nr:LysM peptidoglycan-binding domain-containing protein [Gammaproteobacteria bacterium]